MSVKPVRPSALILAAALSFLAVWTVYASVTLSSFTLTPEDGLVRLDWETGSELDFAGFFVRRSQVNDANYGQWDRIEVEDADTGEVQLFVPARNDFGASYPFIDRAVLNGTPYCYALEAVNNDQSVEYFASEPACTTPGPTPTPTDSPTSTPSPTFTHTPGGASPTLTRTTLPSRTPLPTRTGSPIPSITPTTTDTPTVTVTPTDTPFPTFLPTRTSTSTGTPTPSRTPRPTRTPGPLLAATLSPGGPAAFLSVPGLLGQLTLGELILVLAGAVALVGGLLFAGLYFLVLRNSGQ